MTSQRKIFSKNKPSRLLAILVVVCLFIYGLWMVATGMWTVIVELLG